MEGFLPIALFFVTILIGCGVFVWALVNVLVEVSEKKKISNFSEDFKGAVMNNQPPWEDINEIASSYGITQEKAYFVIIKYNREILAGREHDLSQHKDLIKSYILQYREDEPFQGMPNEIRVHLERLRDKLSGDEHPLEPLTNQIKDLLAINQKEKRQQKYYTIGGFFIGVVGLVYALYTGLK